MNAGEHTEIITAPSESNAVDIGEYTVIQILRVADLLTRIGDSKVFGKELTQPQFNILMILKRHGNGGISQKEILEKLVSTKGNVSIHISNLRNKGYIRRRLSKEDSRFNVITLTPKGERILAELEPKYIQQLRTITDDLPREQAETTIALLDRVVNKCTEVFSGSQEPERVDQGK